MISTFNVQIVEKSFWMIKHFLYLFNWYKIDVKWI